MGERLGERENVQLREACKHCFMINFDQNKFNQMDGLDLVLTVPQKVIKNKIE